MGFNLTKASSLLKYDDLLAAIRKRFAKRAVDLPKEEAQKALPFIKGEITELKPYMVNGRAIYATSEAEAAPEMAKSIINFKRSKASKLGRRLKTLAKSSRVQKRAAIATGGIVGATALAMYLNNGNGKEPPKDSPLLKGLPDYNDNDMLVALLSVLDDEDPLDMEDVRALELAVKLAILPPRVSYLLSQALDDDIFMLFHPEKVLRQYAIPGVEKNSPADIRQLQRAVQDINYIFPELKDFYISGKFLADNDSYYVDAAGSNDVNLLFKLALPTEVVPFIVDYFLYTRGENGESIDEIDGAALRLLEKVSHHYRTTGSTRYGLATSILNEVILNA